MTEEEREKRENKMIQITSQKIFTAILVAIMFFVSFSLFIYYFNSIYKIDAQEIQIKLNGSSEDFNNKNFFLLFGFIASLGSIVRIIYDFIGHTCYTLRFNFKIWWPWYFFLPVLAFILGAFFVIFFDNSLLGADGISNFPFILSFITGFAVRDAISFLRAVSKRIFGTQNDTSTKKND